MIEFRGWPKIARLYRDVVVTEKIDGTNAAIGIQVVPLGTWTHRDDYPARYAGLYYDNEGDEYAKGSIAVYAQSRSRIITPKEDNHGFARWVYDNATTLADVLGPGLHFGEWWGSGINRGYGLPRGEKRFSLFNTSRWNETLGGPTTNPNFPELGVVPILYQGEFSTLAVQGVMESLRLGGSAAAPQFMQPEGVVIFHTASNSMFKATLENDEIPKAVAKKAARELNNVKLVEVSLGDGSPYSDLRLAA